MNVKKMTFILKVDYNRNIKKNKIKDFLVIYSIINLTFKCIGLKKINNKEKVSSR